MNVKISRSLGVIAVLYFTANFSAQQKDTIAKEKKIEEVVLIGYGSVKKQNLTSAVSTVNSDAFDNRPIYNVGQALQGNAAGVNVVQPSGKPGSGLEIKIRGNNSINSSTSPLYVIDGIQTYDISGINPDDIVDMNILKDATSTAIYGVNGSSGVVIITTKRGKNTKGQLSFNAYLGVSSVSKKLDVLDLDQYKTLMKEINMSNFNTANNPRYAGINTNWQDEIFQTGFDQNYNLGYSFGNEKVKAYTSFGYQGIQGIIKPSQFDRISTKVNVDAELAPWLKLNTSLNYFNTNLANTSDNLSTARGGVVLSSLVTPGFLPVYGSQINFISGDTAVYNTDGSIKDGYNPGQFTPNPFQSSWENPVAYQSSTDDRAVNRFMSNLGLEVKLVKGLTWKPNIAYDVTDSKQIVFQDGYQTNYGRQNEGIGYRKDVINSNYNFENTLNYSLKKDAHDLSLLGGFSFQEFYYKENQFNGREFEPGITAFNYDIANIKTETLLKERTRYTSFYGRFVYTYNNKYTIMGVMRATGASALAPGNKWGVFPGVSASWLVSNENFLKGNSTISELKLRGGWGRTGNVSGIPAYSHLDLDRESFIGSGVWNPQQNGNPDLTWETTDDANFGVDLGLLNNRIRLSADIFKRKTKDLLMSINFPSINLPYLYNAGSMENRGMEFNLDTKNFKTENFSWNTNFNISFYKNKILSTGSYQQYLDKAQFETVGESAIRLQSGQPVGSFFGYMVDKVNPADGELLYKDINGNGYFDPGDRTTIGNPNPDFTFGFSNNFKYKNLYLDVLVTGSYGNDIFNASRLDLELMSDFKNQSTAVLDRWTTAGQITNIPKAGTASAQHISDRFVEDGSFIKLKAVTLGYNIKKSFKGVSNINLYVTGQNLLTWTDYSGFDPEVNYTTTQGVLGVDYGTFPQVRTFIFGVKASF